MKVVRNGFFVFNKSYPIHTWYPILTGNEIKKYDNISLWNQIDCSEILNRALYFHIPFCEKQLCSFCSLPRELLRNTEKVQRYVEALTAEITLKCQSRTIKELPVRAIFFGGGSPSVLTPKQMEQIFSCIHENFNLSQLAEWSFENNIQSVSEDKLQIMKKYGITHVRAGVQTLNPKFRKLFNLSPPIKTVEEHVSLMNKYFSNVCIDMIYAVNGQQIDDFLYDIHQACALNTKLIDFYPLSQPCANSSLVTLSKEMGLHEKNEVQMFGMMIMLKEVLKYKDTCHIMGMVL